MTVTVTMTVTMTPPTTRESVFRPATGEDADALTDLERDTDLVALGHVFGGLPYPNDEVRARWTALLADDTVHVEVAGPPDRLEVYLAWDDGSPGRLRHLGVRPECWGTGRARRAVERAVGVRRLWVLRDNARARGFYEHLGWRPTGLEQEAEWPPYPTEVEYAR
ncbi:MAG TPA: GNAT family N-acetyltransferase [Nocardioides sp.]|uniref:GNAT family N-acetyltransferase n=1 Tax=Nocardioides sp. TaxID=35761 RepID=UPI002E310950|nr:GNAT family N-acetyltransferase [Nocardioides sp.]HEX3930681.1 GNAT family N-acetyltransferase [Nocardioides sp.]